MSPSRRVLGLALALAALALSSASPRPDVEALLREGYAACQRGDYSEAVAWYGRAEPYATDPGLVAFNLATAKYHLALAEGGREQTLEEARQLYRCCLDPDDPRRARALYGLGNCLLGRGGAGPAELREAVGCYEECLRDPRTDPALAADARYNLEKARLLLLQAQAPEGRQPNDPAGDEGDRERQPGDRSPTPQPGGEPVAGARQQPDEGRSPTEVQPGQEPTPTNQTPRPGQGTLPPVPDRAELAPLSASDAVEHLRHAAERILEEGQAHRRSRAHPAPPGVRDW
jgi:tetratricopeptide (TPR) repeat protein